MVYVISRLVRSHGRVALQDSVLDLLDQTISKCTSLVLVGSSVGGLVVHSSPFSGERNAPGVCPGSVCASAHDDFGC